ncbi:MAG: endonuclease/exonuclease/phosphatase family protein [Patescibacteria group bacterium]
MKIATFNLRNLFAAGEHKIFDELVTYTNELLEQRLEQAAATISELDADIIVVNEIGSAEVLKTIAGKLPGKYYSFMATPESRGIANGILYRDEQASCKSFCLSPSLPLFIASASEPYVGQLKSYREIIHFITIYAGRPLHVLGLHLKSPVFTPLKNNQEGKVNEPTSQTETSDGIIRSNIRRLAEARALRLVLDQMFSADNNLQVIVTGDFNDTETSATLRAIKGESDLFPERLTNVCERIPQAKRYSIVEGDYQRLIDHVLVSKSLVEQVLSVEIKNDNLQDQDAEPNSAYLIDSDHAPIVVELKD